MQRIITSLGLLCLLLAPAAIAQEENAGPLVLVPVISGPSDVAVGRTLVLDASSSLGVNDTTEYRWFRAGLTQPISRSVEAVFTPEEPGTIIFTLVVSSEVGGELIEVRTERTIIVYERKITLIADSTVPSENLLNHQQQAADAGVHIRVLQAGESALPIGAEEALVNSIKENADALNGAEAIVLWTDGVDGLQALSKVAEEDANLRNAMKNQTLVLITDRGLTTLARTIWAPFSLIEPDRIVVTRSEAINPLITAENVEAFLAALDQRDIDYLIVDESSTALRPWNLLASFVNYMLTHGVASQTVLLLLMLPIIATILAFLKQVIGITTFGLYTPSVIALSFMALGWPVGVSFLLFILITGYATRAFMKRYRMLHIPKVAIILTVVSFTLLLLIGIGAYFNLTLSGDTIFILLIMSTLSESFLNAKVEQGWSGAVLAAIETILTALLCVFIVEWPTLQSIVLAYPEVVLVTLLINAYLGRWTGLRLVEYFRFREVFKHLQEE